MPVCKVTLSGIVRYTLIPSNLTSFVVLRIARVFLRLQAAQTRTEARRIDFTRTTAYWRR
jgi:hypothetical protein